MQHLLGLPLEDALARLKEQGLEQYKDEYTDANAESAAEAASPAVNILPMNR